MITLRDFGWFLMGGTAVIVIEALFYVAATLRKEALTPRRRLGQCRGCGRIIHVGDGFTYSSSDYSKDVGEYLCEPCIHGDL